MIDRDHNTRTNKTEKHRAKEFLYEKIAFTTAFWWDWRRLPNALSRRLKSSFFSAACVEHRATLKAIYFPLNGLARQDQYWQPPNYMPGESKSLSTTLFLLFLVPKLDLCLFLHNFRSRGRLTYYYWGSGSFLGGGMSVMTYFIKIFTFLYFLSMRVQKYKFFAAKELKSIKIDFWPVTYPNNAPCKLFSLKLQSSHLIYFRLSSRISFR